VAYIGADARSLRSDALFSQAQSRFFEFNCRRPDRVLRVRCGRLIPRVLVNVGELRGLIYASDRGGRGVKRTYIHFMDKPPLLACNARGDRLYVVGGRYRVTRRGIEG
jgi:hypothetical protein